MSTANIAYPMKSNELPKDQVKKAEITKDDTRKLVFVDITQDPEFWKKAVLS